MNYTKYSYTRKADAKKKQKAIKKKYGYTPSIFKERNPKTGKTKYVVIKPVGLKAVQ